MLLRNVSRILKHILNMFNVPLVFIKFIVEYICERTCLKVERTPFAYKFIAYNTCLHHICRQFVVCIKIIAYRSIAYIYYSQI